jgi:hypothetical protein
MTFCFYVNIFLEVIVLENNQKVVEIAKCNNIICQQQTILITPCNTGFVLFCLFSHFRQNKSAQQSYIGLLYSKNSPIVAFSIKFWSLNHTKYRLKNRETSVCDPG